MSKATILAVDDDPMVLRAITRDLRTRYGVDYRVVPASSGAEALAVLAELALRLCPVVDDLLADWQRAHPQETGQVRVVGHRWSDRSHELTTFLTRNYVPYQWVDVDRDAQGQRLQALARAPDDDLPLVFVPDR